MSKLEELEEELYGKEETETAKRLKRRVFFQGTSRKPSVSWEEEKRVASTPSPRPHFYKFFWLGLGAVLVLALGVFIFLYLARGGQEAEIAINARTPVVAGELVKVPITFRNVSSTALKEVELDIVLPADTLVYQDGKDIPAPPRIVKKIDDIPPGAEQTEEISARFFGEEGGSEEIQAVLFYRPENLQARFSAKGVQDIIIGRMPLAVFLELPDNLSQGQTVDLKVRYVSNSEFTFKNLALRLDYPPGFNFISAERNPDFGNFIWQIGDLAPGQDGNFNVKGTISGEESETKVFHAALGVFDSLTKEWRPYTHIDHEAKMAVTPLAVQGFLGGQREGLVSAGDKLDFKVHYQNNTASVFKNVSMRAVLSGGILDPNGNFQVNSSAASLPSFDTLEMDQGGVFDAPSNSIVWGPSGDADLKEISPGDSGDLNFSIRLKPQPAIRTDADKNFVLRLQSSAQIPQPPQELKGTALSSEDTLVFKVRSKILFSGRAIYRNSPLANSGPLPPRVGQKTTYTIVWEIRDFNNELQNAEVQAALPPNIKWENSFSPADSRFAFDPSSGEVRWILGNIKAGTGILSPALQGAFKISLTPGEPDLGKSVDLIQEAHLTGQDAFTGEQIDQKIDSLSTELRDDPATSSGDWQVAK